MRTKLNELKLESSSLPFFFNLLSKKQQPLDLYFLANLATLFRNPATKAVGMDLHLLVVLIFLSWFYFL